MPESPTTLDADTRLALLLERHFGLLDARRHAAWLRDVAVHADAVALLERASAAKREAIAGNAPLATIEAANAEHGRASALLERIARWRTSEVEPLALDVFLLAPSVAGAVAREYLPSTSRTGEPPPLLLCQPQLRFADHFEPDLDLLIIDHGLGTIGMVQWLRVDTPEQARARVRDQVDRATYLRHLLAAEQGRERQIFTVELVVVHPAAEPGTPGMGQLAAIGELLRELALETDCLHAIGVNLLPWQDAREPDADELRRAFAWLLRDSRRWFEAIAEHDAARGRSGEARLDRIILDEYRVAGRRELVLHPATRLHLLHGHNGSGKSSLVESLELMLTGNIERLAGVDDYELVIRNRNATKPAAIELIDRSGLRHAFTLAGGERPRALAPGARAASFRIDQTVMDRLARASEVDRAAELLGSFFAEEAATRERWRAAVGAAKRAIDALPERLRGWLRGRQREHQDLHEVVVEQFAGLGEGRLRRELVDALLPVGLDVLLIMRARLPALALLDERLAHDGSIASDDPIFTSLEFELGALVGELDARRASLASAIHALDRAGRWWHEGVQPSGEGDFGEALDEWLELGTLAELAAQQRTILAALQAARAGGWDMRRLDEAGEAGELLRSLAGREPSSVDALAHAHELWLRRRAELSATLEQRSEGETQAGGQRWSAAVRVRLDAEDVAELDELGRWLASEDVGLGERISQAIESRSPSVFAGCTIGARDWANPLRERALALLAALDELAQGRPLASEPSGTGETVVAEPARVEQARVEPARVEPAPLVAEPARDEDAPHEARRERDSIGSLPITVEEAPPISQASEDELLELGPDDDEQDDDRDDYEHDSTLSRIARSIFGRKRERIDERQQAQTRIAPVQTLAPPASAPRPSASASPQLASAPRPGGGGRAEHAPAPAPARASTSATMKRFELRSMLERLRHAQAAAAHAQQVGVEVRHSFIAKLAAHDEGAMGLVDALNELMAVFTPARWAYEDVQLRYEEGDAPRLQFETGSAGATQRSRADLRLNTAQLNAFVLALFLLCAPRVSNPLGLLVLDDPLQNMDELTVTTLARGLAKLLRVLPRRWTLMMLFHGEGDLARFHDEVECGVYLLPWLSPTQRGSAIEIACRPQTSRLGLQMQSLLGFIRLRP